MLTKVSNEVVRFLLNNDTGGYEQVDDDGNHTDDGAIVPGGVSSHSHRSKITGVSPPFTDEPETWFEFYLDWILGLAFLVTAIVAAKRMLLSRQQQNQGGGAETYVVTAFYSLIGATSLLRTIWFLIPARVWKPEYVPIAVFAWENEHESHWVGAMFSEITVTAGSLTLFAIFILILVYWADILKKYFHPGARRSVPMYTFFFLVASLCLLELLNLCLFLGRVYTTEGMILYNAVLLAIVSLVCVCEITIFSHRFRTVLQTLGAINQVSTDTQVRRIVWITVTGNLFFSGRAILEVIFATVVVGYWHRYGTVQKVFTHAWWDTYTVLKYGSELTILALMLYILQSRFSSTSTTAANGRTAPSQTNKAGYQPVPNVDTTAPAQIV